MRACEPTRTDVRHRHADADAATRIPIHFNVGGEPDDFGPRSSALWLGGIMTALGLLLAWLSTRPHVLNYPGEVTERNAQHVYRVGEQLMVGVLAALTCVYFGIC